MTAKRIKKTKIYILPVIAVLIFALLISAAIYFLFLKPSYINCGIFLDKRDNGSTINVKLGCGDKVKWIKVSKRIGLPEGSAYNVKMKGIVVSSITACKSFSGKVYSYDKNKRTVELDSGVHKLAPDVIFYRISAKNQQTLSPDSLITGTSNASFIESKGMIAAVIVGTPDLANIRVGLTTKLRHSQKHRDIVLYSRRIITIKYGNEIIQAKDFAIGISYAGGYMQITAYDQNGTGLKYKSTYGRTKERITAFSDYPYAVPISFKSFDIGDSDRNAYDFPEYYGSLEFSLNDKCIKAVNEVDLDTYVKNVVLSKKNDLGDYPTACSVQAITSRTLAVSDILSGNEGKFGYHVIDTLPELTYNPDLVYLDETRLHNLNKRKEFKLKSNAIDTTSGMVLTYKGELIDTKNYSTSCGVGTPYNDVWFKGSLPTGKNEKPYLAFGNYTASKIDDLSSDVAAANFLKDWTIKSYDANSKFFRWKYSLDFTTLSKIVNANIYRLYCKDKADFKKKWYFSIYRDTAIPKSGIGKITDIKISKRGISGNVLELTLVSELGEFRVARDSNIKQLLVSKDIEIDFIYGNPVSGFTTPPSSFFVIDKPDSKSLEVYGGGSGHGVGMSQYGVIGMIRAGKSYKNIIRSYYHNVAFQGWQDVVNANFSNSAK